MHDGLPASLHRQLATIAGGDSRSAIPAPGIGAGAHIVRDWNGRTYRVEVLARLQDGRTHLALAFRHRAADHRHGMGGTAVVLRAHRPRGRFLMQKVRCAIYTRKSSEDGLEQEFNSLHAQREACAAYVLSQKAEGWVLLPEHDDGGGLFGGTLERPALQPLLAAVDEGLVDRIVGYKIDRLTRSLRTSSGSTAPTPPSFR